MEIFGENSYLPFSVFGVPIHHASFQKNLQNRIVENKKSSIHLSIHSSIHPSIHTYHKTPKINPWAYIFQVPFLGGVTHFLDGLVIFREVGINRGKK